MSARVGFAGMTHLGLVSATGMASKGFEVICYDSNPALVADLRAGRLPVLEPGLDDMVVANGARQKFTSDLTDIGACDVVYIAPDVPTDDQGRSDLGPITGIIARILPVLGPEAVLVVLCQVPPGFTRGLPLARARLYYQVETLIFGQAVERATETERFIVGCDDPGRPLPPHYREVLDAFNCPILPMRYESAELAKISINMCLVASISVANTMAELCENLGAVWSEIVPALKLDRRIGEYSYLAPGLGIAGGNLERDLATVIRLAAEHGADAGVVEAWVRNSRHRRDWAVRKIRETVLSRWQKPVLAVWGLAYKENTHSVKNSPSLATLRQLPGLAFRLHDPVVSADDLDLDGAVQVPDALSALGGAQALAILTPWPEYREVPLADIVAAVGDGVVIDPYRVLDPVAAGAAGLDYHTLGMPSLTVGRRG